LAVGYASLRLRKWAADPRIEILLSLLTPFIAYWPPAHVGGSGVLAACVCGLYVSWNGPLLIPAATRLQGIFFWDLLIYVLEGALFLLTGLEARPLLERIVQVSGAELALAALAAARKRGFPAENERTAVHSEIVGSRSGPAMYHFRGE
jgi:NhaP-type Na+/H+ or K+/H+ antiporter